jgi:8-amino-7-oxononanoate synthase
LPGQLRAELDSLAAASLLRTRRVVRQVDATHVELEDGRRLINFAANDYLALSHHPHVRRTVANVIRTEGFGSGASALISGYTQHHAEAERRIAAWKGTEAAVLLGSGYQANLAAIQTIASLAAGLVTEVTGTLSPGQEDAHGVRFLLDKLVHASLIDAVRGSGLPFRIFPHNGLAKLKRLLAEADPRELQVVVTESVFSMDGDTADLHGLAALKAGRPFVLLLDEAHASGVYGRHGAGLAAELGVAHDVVDVSVVTLSKALGCFRGAVCASRDFCDLLANRGRAYVFATSLPGCVAAGVTGALDVIEREPEHARRLRDIARRVRTALSLPGPPDSPILPVILGDAGRAVRAAEQLQSKGLWVLAVRPPTVSRGSSRLRVTLSSAHSDDEIDRLIAALVELRSTAP